MSLNIYSLASFFVVGLPLLFTMMISQPASALETPKPIALWPNGAPDDKANIGPEKDMTGPKDGLVAGKPVIRLGNVTVPTITVYHPAPGKETGTAVVVCPGGGYSILAMDLEGTEVCEWLNSIGVTAILLKYRVPKREGQEPHVAPLQDAQRALGMVRSRAGEWGLKPDRIGILGFSAGAHLSAALSTNYDKRTYPTVDAADAVNCRPDFAILIYSAYLTQPREGIQVSPELRVSATTPPTFLAQTGDDNGRVEGSVGYYMALRNAHVPAELHVYPTGGHGYGLRPAESAIPTAWPRLAEAWLRQSKLL